jgi:hypothetical protein
MEKIVPLVVAARHRDDECPLKKDVPNVQHIVTERARV